MSTCKFQLSGLCNSKTCITHKRNLGIGCKFENKLIPSMCTELCHKNSVLGSQNAPLIGGNRHRHPSAIFFIPRLTSPDRPASSPKHLYLRIDYYRLCLLLCKIKQKMQVKIMYNSASSKAVILLFFLKAKT